MSTTKIKQGVLSDVYFFYTKIKEAGTKFQSDAKMYSTVAVMSKDNFLKLQELTPSVKVKKLEAEEFTAKYKIDPPFPAQSLQYVVNFSQDLESKDGKPFGEGLRPRVYKVSEDGKSLEDITTSHNVGNGSRGDVRFNIISNDFGTFPKLSALRINDLVEYGGSEGQKDEWAASVTTPPASSSPKSPAFEADDTDDAESDDPF